MSEQDRIAFEKWAKDHEYAIDDYVYALEIWNAATSEANKRIEVLHKQIIEMTAYEASMQRISCEDTMKIAQIQASNHDLRDTLLKVRYRFFPENQHESERDLMWDDVSNALSTTPAESLQAHDDVVIFTKKSLQQHDNEVIEKCARRCERVTSMSGRGYAEAIRALKEVK